MAVEWFCDIEGKQHGPMSPYQLKELADSGKLQATHMIWKSGMQTKVPARTVRGLFDSAPAGPPPVVKSEPAAPARESAAAKTLMAAPPAPIKTQIADAATTAEVPAATSTWVEKSPLPKPAPKKEDDVVETQVAEDVVDTQVAEDVVETAAAVIPLAPVEPVEPMVAVEPALPKKTTSRDKGRPDDKEGRERDRGRPTKRDRDHEAEAAATSVNITASPPTVGKPFRVLAGGQLSGPYSLDELQKLLAAGKFSAADLIGVETWLPVATLAALPLASVSLAPIPSVAPAASTPIVAAAAAKPAPPAKAPPKKGKQDAEIVETLADVITPEEDVIETESLGSLAEVIDTNKVDIVETESVAVKADTDDDVQDIPLTDIEEVKETKPAVKQAKPEPPKSGGDFIAVDEEFQL